jgi:exopolyphosphatase/guanosine-5'-triphosphate,3'-diphosphate pyrophosphatase
LKAIIDLGTNTFHLLIAEVKGDMLHVYFQLQVPVKLGSGGINSGIIQPDAYERGMLALTAFRKYLNQFQVTDVTAFATSAIRNASNGKQFIDDVSQRCNINVTAITGDTEAAYIYKGVYHSFNLPDKPVLVMDIGGGSVEFIIGKGEQVIWKQSFEIGAARLIEKFKPSNPIAEIEVAQLHLYLDKTLTPLFSAVAQYQPELLIGSAGAFETLVDVLINDLAVIPHSLSLHAFEIRKHDFEVFVEIMKTSTSEQRARLRGMIPFRIEMITVAALLMDFVVNQTQLKRIVASNYALKEGVLFS